jgi:hypothetical protein
MAIIKPNNNTISAITALPSGMTSAPGLSTGKVLQYVFASTATGVTSTSNTFADIGITASITPSSSSNKIYIDVNCPDNRKWSANTNLNIAVYRQINGGGYSELKRVTTGLLYTADTDQVTAGCSGVIEDSTHNTTNQIDYKIYIANGQNSGNVKINVDGNSETSIIAYEVEA